MQIRKAYRFRFYPTEGQREILAKTFGCCRFVYNYMLRIRTDAWANDKVRVDYHKTSRLLTELKKNPEYQRRLAKKQKCSKNHAKARLKVAKLHTQIKDSRTDFLHKLSTRIINENQVICLEDLNVKGMVKSRHLSKTISDQGWSEFVRQLEYKAGWYGRKLLKADPWFPSTKRCSNCGYTLDKMPLNIREWTCPECHAVHDRDINASRNILAVGMAVSACGDHVRPNSFRSEAMVNEAGIPAL